MTETVGFLGAGQMGEPMVRRLLAAGHAVKVYARRPEVRDRLAQSGASLADGVAEVASASDVLIVCLFSDAQLCEAGMGPDGFITNARPGSVVVSHTTGTVSTLRELAEGVAAPPTIVDAPVSGTADDIAAGHLTVLIGGPPTAVERVAPILGAYADPLVRTGELGSALSIKLINNALFAANAQLVVTAAFLGKELGVDSNSLLDALAVCSGDSRAAAYVRAVGSIEGFAEMITPFLRKDAAAVKAAAGAAGANLGLLGSVIATGLLDLAPESTTT